MEKTVSVVMDLINDQFWGGGGHEHTNYSSSFLT